MERGEGCEAQSATTSHNPLFHKKLKSFISMLMSYSELAPKWGKGGAGIPFDR